MKKLSSKSFRIVKLLKLSYIFILIYNIIN